MTDVALAIAIAIVALIVAVLGWQVPPYYQQYQRRKGQTREHIKQWRSPKIRALRLEVIKAGANAAVVTFRSAETRLPLAELMNDIGRDVLNRDVRDAILRAEIRKEFQQLADILDRSRTLAVLSAEGGYEKLQHEVGVAQEHKDFLHASRGISRSAEEQYADLRELARRWRN